jgi:hypothetical protein
MVWAGKIRGLVTICAVVITLFVCSGCALQVDLRVSPSPQKVGQATTFTGTVTDVSNCSVDNVQYCLVPFAELSENLRAKLAQLPKTASPQFAPANTDIASAVPADAFAAQAMAFNFGTLPAGCSEQSVGGATGICCMLGTLTAGQMVTVSLVVTPTATGSFDNTASASGSAGSDCPVPGAAAEGGTTLRTGIIPPATAPLLSRGNVVALCTLLALVGVLKLRPVRRPR